MSKGVTWFKMFLSFYPLINAIPSQNVGEGVKAAMQYFKTGEEPTELQEMADAIYNMLKDSIDQAFTDCEERSEKARKSIMTRWHGNDTTEYDRIRPNTEEKRREKKRGEERRGEETTPTTTDSTYTGTPAGGGAGGGDFPPDILAYAREMARGANNPAAYEAAILERIRKAGFKTIEEVKAADEDRRKRASAAQGPVYAEEDDFY